MAVWDEPQEGPREEFNDEEWRAIRRPRTQDDTMLPREEWEQRAAESAAMDWGPVVARVECSLVEVVAVAEGTTLSGTGVVVAPGIVGLAAKIAGLGGKGPLREFEYEVRQGETRWPAGLRDFRAGWMTSSLTVMGLPPSPVPETRWSRDVRVGEAVVLVDRHGLDLFLRPGTITGSYRQFDGLEPYERSFCLWVFVQHLPQDDRPCAAFDTEGRLIGCVGTLYEGERGRLLPAETITGLVSSHSYQFWVSCGARVREGLAMAVQAYIDDGLISLDPRVHAGIGKLYAEYGHHAAALDALTRAVELDPLNAWVQHRLAETLEALGRRDEAADRARKARELDRIDAEERAWGES
jgi:tetratricopeptide (TPR) repeat protein